YNLICRISNKCQPIILSALIPHKKGQERLIFSFNAEIPDELKDKVEFFPKAEKLEVINGKNIINSYQLKNLTNQEITVQAHYSIIPQEIDRYLNRIECLCFQRQVLEAKEEVEMRINFIIDSAIENDEKLKDVKEIKVSYKVMKLN